MNRAVERRFPHFTYKSLSRFDTRLKHFTSTRKGGFSQSPFGEMNMSLSVGDDQSTVISNRKLLADCFGVQVDQVIFARQIHKNLVKSIDRSFLSLKTEEKNACLSGTDGLVTDLNNVMICILTADCAGVLLYDPVKAVIGVVHAGWRGTTDKIVKNAIDLMKNKYQVNPQDIFAVVTPCISVKNYEVGEEVVDKFEEIFEPDSRLVDYEFPKAHINIALANKMLLIQAGLIPEQIELSNYCTFEDHHQFYSARRGDLGRFSSGLMMI